LNARERVFSLFRKISLSDTITEDNVCHFNRNDVDILRHPVRASMADGTVLRGYYFERKFPKIPGQFGADPGDTPLLCLPTELGNSREFFEFAMEQKGFTRWIFAGVGVRSWQKMTVPPPLPTGKI